jgi:hypothetical protein
MAHKQINECTPIITFFVVIINWDKIATRQVKGIVVSCRLSASNVEETLQ